MKTIRDIQVSIQEGYYVTNGLNKIIGYEISLLIHLKEESAYLSLLNYLINYFIDSNPIIKPEQTVTYCSWLLKFILINKNLLTIYEAIENGDGFIEGADYSIKLIEEQINECEKYNATPLFPTFSQMVVVSKGVFDGKLIDAVRYQSPNHMSGWWLTTDLYNGDIKSLETIHYYHVAFKIPDILKYLALPNGFRFYTGRNHDVWFDKEIHASSSVPLEL